MPFNRLSSSPVAKRAGWSGALLRGLGGGCPSCGTGRLFTGYIRLNAACDHCGTALEPHRADDAPAYFTIFLVGHIVVPAMLVLERVAHPAVWVHWSLWIPLTLALTLLLLPRVKGAVVGLQWALDVRQDD